MGEVTRAVSPHSQPRIHATTRTETPLCSDPEWKLQPAPVQTADTRQSPPAAEREHRLLLLDEAEQRRF